MSFVKTIATLAISSFLSFNISAEEATSSSEKDASSGFQSDFLTWLNEGKKSLVIGNYTSYGKSRSDRRLIFNRVEGGTVGYSSTYFVAGYETQKVSNFQFGLGLYGHVNTFDTEDAYEEKYPENENIYFTDLYVKYHLNDQLFVQGGRFNIRDVARRFDPQYGEGGLLQFDNGEDIKFQLGFVTQFASFWNDSVFDFTGVDDIDRFSYDTAAGEEVDSVVYYSELTLKLSENLTINPYAYYQDKYVGWYGLDTTVSFKSDDSEYGVHLYSYYIDPLIESNVDDIQEGSFNFSINPFYAINHWQFMVGYSKFGDNSELNNPYWGYKYFTNALYEDVGAYEAIDFNNLYGEQGTESYFGRIGYAEDTWLLSFSAAYYLPEDTATQNELWELQIGGSLKITENLDFGGRIVSIISNEKVGVVDQDADYFEAWITYTF